MDVTLRIEPLAHDLERTREPILIVGHQGIHRILYAYFMGLSREEAPFVRIPLNHVIVLKPHAVSGTTYIHLYYIISSFHDDFFVLHNMCTSLISFYSICFTQKQCLKKMNIVWM